VAGVRSRSVTPRGRTIGLLAATALGASCGRLEYDPIGDASTRLDAADGSSHGDAPIGGDSGAACAAPETCNGIDDDCDAEIDEGCPCTPFLAWITTDGTASGGDVDWTGTGFGVLWAANAPATGERALYLREVDASSAMPGAEIELTRGTTHLGNWSLAWNGAQHAVLTIEDVGGGVGQARLRTIDPGASIASPAVDVSPPGALHGKVIAAARGFVVASLVGDQLYLRRIEGGVHTEHLVGTLATDVSDLTFAADETGGIVIAAGASIGPALALPLDPELRARGAVVSLGDALSNVRVVRAAAADHWLVGLWRPNELVLQPTDGAAQRIGTEVTQAASAGLGLARAGPVAVVAGLGSDLRFFTMRVDPDTGVALEAPVSDGTAGNPRSPPSVAGAAGRVALAWMTSYRIELVQRCF
jgi:hypothetical protein